MPRENDLEGQQDMGGEHGGQAGMPRPESESGTQQGIVRDKKGQEQPADEDAAQKGAPSKDAPRKQGLFAAGARDPSQRTGRLNEQIDD